MSVENDDLRELYVEITGTEAVTEQQKESISHEPHGEEAAELDQAVSDVTRHEGLSDAVGSGSAETE